MPPAKPKPKKPPPATLARRHRQQRERNFWEWTLDLGPVTTEKQFVALIKDHFRERVRGGFLRELRITAGARFWAQLNWELACYFGNIHVRVTDWAAFQQRLPAVAKRLQTCFRQLRGEIGAGGFRVEYDSTPATGVRQRTLACYFFLGPKCKLTVPALAAALRKWKTDPPPTVIARTWTKLEFDFGLDTRTVPKAAGLDVQLGGRRLHLALNANAKRVSQLLAFLEDTGTMNDGDELAPCRRVLEAWSEEADPDGALPAHWQPLLRYVEAAFPGALIEFDDPLADSE